MTRTAFASLILACSTAVGLVSCADEPVRKPVGPVSETSPISWTGQVTSPIQGQLGMMPQNQNRR